GRSFGSFHFLSLGELCQTLVGSQCVAIFGIKPETFLEHGLSLFQSIRIHENIRLRIERDDSRVSRGVLDSPTGVFNRLIVGLDGGLHLCRETKDRGDTLDEAIEYAR